jgi:antitoxin (DNA-binding transcriptional repressor) of toxin-antitoxin stability system
MRFVLHEGSLDKMEKDSMTTVTLQEAQLRLPELIAKLQPGEELIITRDNQPVARLTPQPPDRKPRRAGTLKGSVLYMAPDFDAPLEESACTPK